MLQSQERIALALLIGVCISIFTVQLLIDAIGREPFTIHYGDGCNEGDLVWLEGDIDTLIHTSSGDHLILDINGTRIFIPEDIASSLNLREGDTVILTGTVAKYKGIPEIVLSSAQDLRVTESKKI